GQASQEGTLALCVVSNQAAHSPPDIVYNSWPGVFTEQVDAGFRKGDIMTTTTLQIRSLMPTLTVNDLKLSLQFYRDGLGFSVGEEMKEGGQLTGVLLEAGGAGWGLSQDDFAKGRDRVKRS